MSIGKLFEFFVTGLVPLFLLIFVGSLGALLNPLLFKMKSSVAKGIAVLLAIGVLIISSFLLVMSYGFWDEHVSNAPEIL